MLSLRFLVALLFGLLLAFGIRPSSSMPIEGGKMLDHVFVNARLSYLHAKVGLLQGTFTEHFPIPQSTKITQVYVI